MTSEKFSLTIINPKKFFGLVKQIESKGLLYCIEINNNTNLKFICSKVDGSIQFIHSYELSDMIMLNQESINIPKIIFSIHFNGKAARTLDFFIKYVQECTLSLKYSENKSYYFLEELYSTDQIFKQIFSSDLDDVEDMQKIYNRLKLLPVQNEKPMLEFSLPNYILKKNTNNPENDLCIYLYDEELGKTIIFSDENYNLQILGDFKTTKNELAVKINSQHLKYLGTEEYLVQVFSKYLLFSSTVKDSKFYITSTDLSAEKLHE
jgi:hypothetical protein